jgi:hypothetical protein
MKYGGSGEVWGNGILGWNGTRRSIWTSRADQVSWLFSENISLFRTADSSARLELGSLFLKPDACPFSNSSSSYSAPKLYLIKTVARYEIEVASRVNIDFHWLPHRRRDISMKDIGYRTARK